MQSFNPRTHTGCDVRQIGKEVFNVVSIHAPTRGATVPMENCGVFPVFQSTHPHGVRLSGTDTCSRFAGPSFNPRTHTGCDSVQSYIL